MDAYFWAKALHLVSIVSWFAGLFYIGRLFIYHAEALEKPEPERGILTTQYALMERRLWNAITTPAAVATFLTGVWLLVLTEAWRLPWFHAKAVLLLLLYAYHGRSGRIRRNLSADRSVSASSAPSVPSVKALRFWNEAATVLLFTVVFTAVSKRAAGAGYGLLAVIALTAVGMTVFLWSRRSRRRGRARAS